MLQFLKVSAWCIMKCILKKSDFQAPLCFAFIYFFFPVAYNIFGKEMHLSHIVE